MSSKRKDKVFLNSRTASAGDFDWWSIGLYLMLTLIGCVMIYATDYQPSDPVSIFDFSTKGGKQFVFLGICIVTGFLIMMINPQILKTFAYLIYGVCIVLLIGVMAYGAVTKGAMSWFQLPGGIKFQPSEISKFATAIALATYLSSSDTPVTQFPKNLIALGVFGLPSLLVVLQGDPGSALVFMAFLIPLFREGFYNWVYILIFGVALLFVFSLICEIQMVIVGILLLLTPFTLAEVKYKNILRGLYVAIVVAVLFLYQEYPQYCLIGVGVFFVITILLNLFAGKKDIVPLLFVIAILASSLAFSVNYLFNQVLKPHQRDRINVWLMPEKADRRGSYYNLRQSKLAIGSGGLTGKGRLQGEMTQGDHVPEQHTDFIFTVVGEEFGFLGTTTVILLYIFFIIRLTFVAERQRSRFTRIYAYGIAGIISIHLLINVGMTTGLMPVIGIPLPLMSYGGSSLLSFSIMLAVLWRFDSQRLLVFR